MGMQENSWSLYNPSLPNVTIKELEIVYGSNTLRAATWGRGLWEFNLVGRENFPSILQTQISNLPTDVAPKENMNQYVNAIISYPNTLSSVYLEYAIDDNNNSTTSIEMLNTQDSTWVSEVPLPYYPSGTKVYFTVYATGNNNDTTETYQFMYTVKPGDGLVYGCTVEEACNYNPAATGDDQSCEYADFGYDCDGNCIEGEGVCDALCSEDLNSDGVINVPDLLLILIEIGCVSSCENDINLDGAVTVEDLLLVLSNFGEYCE
jgi:hypothetical protein